MEIASYRSDGYKDFDLKDVGFDKVWNVALYNELYPDFPGFYNEIKQLLFEHGVNKDSCILDSCCGSGFLTKDLFLDGFNIDFADKYPQFGQDFLSLINKEMNVSKTIIKATWSNYKECADLSPNSYDLIFNRGNSFIYASGDINKKFSVDPVSAELRFVKALEGLFYVLKPGGVLLLDKYHDEEVPFRCDIGFDLNSQKKIVWYCNRKPELGYREASIGLEDNSDIFMHYCDDLTEPLLIKCATRVGFEIEKIKLEHEKNFAVYLLKKRGEILQLVSH